jgi:hypothetical protein
MSKRAVELFTRSNFPVAHATGLVLLTVLVAAPVALAASYPGEQLVLLARNYFIAPLGIFSLLIVLTGSMFNPQMVRVAGYTLIIAVVLFGVISMASQIMSAMQAV